LRTKLDQTSKSTVDCKPGSGRIWMWISQKAGIKSRKCTEHSVNDSSDSRD